MPPVALPATKWRSISGTPRLKAAEAIKNARYFVDSWGADFLVGVDSSGQALALAPIMAELDRVLMVTHAATEKLTEEQVYKNGIKQIFRICNATYQDGNAAAFVAKDLPAKTWATISPKYEYGYTCWNMFKNTLGKLKSDASLSPNPGRPSAPPIFVPTSTPSWTPNRKGFIPPNGPAN